jgi:hypothetical protein
MLQAHSFLWHYLWVAPNVFLLFLSWLVWKRGLLRQFPAFFVFAVFSALAQLSVYTADILPNVSAENFWRVDWVCLMVEGPLKFALVAEIFARVFGPYASIARLGTISIRSVGAVLVFTSALIAAYAPQSGSFGIVSGAHQLDQTIYLIETGLLLFIFAFSYYFNLLPGRQTFGIALGLSISACVHLATWAIMANSKIPNSARYNLDFVNMSTYHLSVLLWYYYLLVPGKVRQVPIRDLSANPLTGVPSEADLDALNQEMERLLHR